MMLAWHPRTESAPEQVWFRDLLSREATALGG